MKKCPYCFESIQEEAIKCRFCNERLDKKSILESASTFLTSIKNKHEENKTKHLFQPTESKPIVINHIKVYEDRFEAFDLTFNFDIILSVFFKADSQSLNLNTTRYLNFMISYLDASKKERVLNLANEYKSGFEHKIVSKTELETYLLILEIISKATYDFRRELTLRRIEKYKAFNYMEYSFKPNGDVTKESSSKVICNLFEAKKENKISWGTEWGNYKSSEYNPYKFKVLSGAPQVKFLFGLFETGGSFSVETIQDTDVFNYVMAYFLKKEKFPIFNE